MKGGKSVAAVVLALVLLASAGCQSAPSNDVSDADRTVHTRLSGAKLPGEPGALCPTTRLVAPDAAFAKAILVCGPDPSAPPSNQEWVITNVSEGVLRVTPHGSGQRLTSVAPLADDADPARGAAARVVPADPDKAGSVLVPAHGYVRVTGGYPVDVDMDYAHSAMSILTASIVTVGLKRFGPDYLNTMSYVVRCTTGTGNVLAKYASPGREDADYFTTAQPDYVHATACIPVFEGLQLGSLTAAAAAAVEDTIFRDMAEQTWRPLAKLIVHDSLAIVPKSAR